MFARLEVPKEPHRTGCLAEMVLSNKFELAVSFAIGMYMICAIYETNWLLQNNVDFLQLPFELKLADLVFEGLYVLEVLLRLVVHRVFFFVGHDKWWNTFDFFMVLLAVASHLIVNFALGLNPLLLRFVRMVRFGFKVFRFLQLTRYISDLRLMVFAFVNSLVSLTWCVFLLGGFMLIHALFLCQQFAVYLAQDGNNLEPADKLKIQANFGSVHQAMLTLLMSISGGVDWGDMYEIVRLAGPFNATVFLVYIVLAWLSLSNIITSIFLEKVMHLARPEAHTRALLQFKEDLVCALKWSGSFKLSLMGQRQ